jgi:PEP-CTERM motif
MLRNTFFAVLTVLAAAASSQAATMLQATSTPLDSGLTSWTLMGVSTAGEIINGVNNPTIVAAGGGAGLHQVWQPVLGATPTRGDQSALFADAWRPYDSFWHFDTTNSLSVGGAFTETNSETGGKPDLPPGAGGAARTGYGTMGFATGSASKAFTIASGRQGTNVPFGQFVLKNNEQAMVSLGIIDNAGGNTRIENFMLGGGVGMPPIIDNVNLGDTTAAIINHTFVPAAGSGPIASWSIAPTTGSPAEAATISPTGVFQWHTIGSARSETGVPYSWTITATGPDGSDTGVLSLELVVPEPATMSLIGIAMVGLVGFARRRS